MWWLTPKGAQLDELFAMFVWNQGVGYFASYIGPSSLFGAYQLIKKLEAGGKCKVEFIGELTEHFGEKNPAVGTFFNRGKPAPDAL